MVSRIECIITAATVAHFARSKVLSAERNSGEVKGGTVVSRSGVRFSYSPQSGHVIDDGIHIRPMSRKLRNCMMHEISLEAMTT